MLKQAYDRSASEEMCLAQKRKRRAITLGIYQSIIGIIAAFFACANYNNVQFFTIFFTGLVGIGITLNGIDYKIQKSEIEELEKYDLYLNLRRKIVGVPNKILFAGIKSDERNININHLDDFSLSDVKRINQNIKRFQKYSQANGKVTYPTLTYKNRKNQ